MGWKTVSVVEINKTYSRYVIHGMWVGDEGEGYFHAIGLGTSTEFCIIFRAAETVIMDYAKCWDARRVQQGPYPQKGLQSC